MKRFLTSVNYPNKKSREKNDHTSINEISNEEIIDDPTTNEATGFDQTKHNTNILSNHYLFDGQFYTILQTNGNKLIAKCLMCSKKIHGQINSTGNFLSHIKVCSIVVLLNFLL